MKTLSFSKDFVFTNRIIGDRVFMLLNQGIGPDPSSPDAPYIDGSRFADEMYFWKGEGKQITVKINSPGGRIDHGWSIIDAIQQCQADTEDIGIAFSMGGICLLFGSNRRAYNYAVGMLHAPRGSGKQILEIVKNQFRALLETRTKFTAEEIDDIMTSGKDYFFTAEEMLEKGIIDEIMPADINITPPIDASPKALWAFYNNYLEKHENDSKQNKIEMSSFIAKLFKKESDEDAAVAAMEMKAENESLKNKVSKMENEIEDLKAKLEESKAEAKAKENKIKAVALINDAEKAGKVSFKDDADKAKAIESAIANYEGFKAMVDGIQPQKPEKKNAAVSIPDAEGKKTQHTYEYLAKHDPKKLADIAENDPELFARLTDEYNESKTTS